MREKENDRMKKVCSVLLLAVLCIGLAASGLSGSGKENGSRAAAASKKEKAKRAFAKYMLQNRKKSYYDEFAVLDVDKDGVPELFLRNGSRFNVFRYKNGHVQEIKMIIPGNEDWGNFSCRECYPSKKLLVINQWNSAANDVSYYKISGNKIEKMLGKGGFYVLPKKDRIDYGYSYNGKKISKAKYKALVKKIKKSPKKKINYKEINDANISKLL